jgi:hypothetical protein
MKGFPIAPALFALAAASVAPADFASASSQPMSSHPPIRSGGGGLPDLVITSFGLKSWGVCAPGKPAFTFQVVVKNQGTAALAGQEVVVWVHDLKSPPFNAWDVGVGEVVTLKPGESHAFTAPISYYSYNPSFMTSGAPHPFQAVVNPKHTIAESNYANNDGPGPAVWSGQHVIMVAAPKGCPPSAPVFK